MTNLERSRYIEGLQGGINPAEIDTDVDIFTVKDIGDAVLGAAKQYKDYKNAEAKALAEQLEREYYLESQAIELSNMGSAEKEDAHYMLDKQYVGKLGLKASDAISVRNFMGTGLKDMMTYQIEQKQIETIAAKEKERTEAEIKVANEVFPFAKDLSVEQQIKLGTKARGFKTLIDNSSASLAYPDTDIQDKAIRDIADNFDELTRYRVFQELLSKPVSPADVQQFYAETATQIQNILLANEVDIEPAVIQRLTNYYISEKLTPLMEQAKVATDLSDKAKDNYIKMLAFKGFREMSSKNQQTVAIATEFKTNEAVTEVIKDFYDLGDSTPTIKKVGDASSSMGSYYLVTKAGDMPTNIPLTAEGKQIASQNEYEKLGTKNVNSKQSLDGVSALNSDRQINEGLMSLPEERRLELRDKYIAKMAPVLARVGVESFGKEMVSTGQDLEAGKGWTTEKRTREAFYDDLYDNVDRLIKSQKQSALFPTESDKQALSDAVTDEMVKILNKEGKAEKGLLLDMMQGVSQFLWGVFDIEPRSKTVKRFGEEGAVTRFLKGE